MRTWSYGYVVAVEGGEWDPPAIEKTPGKGLLLPVPKHLATPTLMIRAGDAAVYDEPEVDRVTPRGNAPIDQGFPAEDLTADAARDVRSFGRVEENLTKSSAQEPGGKTPGTKLLLPAHLHGAATLSPSPAAPGLGQSQQPEPNQQSEHAEQIDQHEAAAKGGSAHEDPSIGDDGMTKRKLFISDAERLKPLTVPGPAVPSPPPPPPPMPMATGGNGTMQPQVRFNARSSMHMIVSTDGVVSKRTMRRLQCLH